MNDPKIVIGLGGNIDGSDIDKLTSAGAQEFYIGYVPAYWSNTFGYATSPNRRCWRTANYESIEAVSKAIASAHSNKAKVSLALNEHLYSARTRALADNILEEAVLSGIDAVIVTDIDFFLSTREAYPDLDIHISGETGVYNIAAVQQFGRWGASRIILPRNLTIDEIHKISSTATEFSMDIEAFIMSERCAFEGAFCYPSHGYLEKHLCNDMNDPHYIVANADTSFIHSELADNFINYRRWMSHDTPSTPWLGGECGLCAVQKLNIAGVNYLKIVGRGASKQDIITRVRIVSDSLTLPKAGFYEACRNLIGSNEICSQNYRCYYRV